MSLLTMWMDELEALKARDEEERLTDAEYARWNELAEMIADGYVNEARLYDRREEASIVERASDNPKVVVEGEETEALREYFNERGCV